MSLNNVEAALVQAFIDGAFFAEGEMAFENAKFTPPAAKPWAALFFRPGQPLVATLGSNGEDYVEGFLQIDLNYPIGSGNGAVRAKYEAIKNLFKAGARFTSGGQVVIIKSCGHSGGRVVDSKFRVSVTVVFYAHINR